MGVLLELTTQTEADNTGSWKTGRKMGHSGVFLFEESREYETQKKKNQYES